MLKLSWVSCALLVCLLGGTPKARAQAPTDETADQAQRHLDRGTTLFNLGRLEEAIGEYRLGYEQSAHPVFLFNIAQAYRQLRAHDKARFFYQRYLSTSPDAPNRAQVEERMAELEQAAPAGTTAPAPTPAPLPLPRALDPHDDGPLTADRAVLDRINKADLLVTAPRVPAKREPPRLWHKWWFWAGAGALVLGGIAAGLLISTSGGQKAPTTDLGHERFF